MTQPHGGQRRQSHLRIQLTMMGQGSTVNEPQRSVRSADSQRGNIQKTGNSMELVTFNPVEHEKNTMSPPSALTLPLYIKTEL